MSADNAEQEAERRRLWAREVVLQAAAHLDAAIAARDAAQLKIRESFHARWGSYWKCGRCGGSLLPGHVSAPPDGVKRCPHGDHDILPIHNGYSWTTDPR